MEPAVRAAERQAELHEAHKRRTRQSPAVAGATFRYLLVRQAAIDALRGVDVHERWREAKERDARAAQRRSGR